MQHSFDVELAIQYGIKEAILLNYLCFWIEKNKANNVHYYDNHYWTYNSIKAFKELFPYMSERQINNSLNKLKEQGLIITGNYNKSTYDRTTWYAFTEIGMSIMQKCKMHFTKVGVSIMQKCKMEDTKVQNGYVKNVKPIPDNKPNNITDNKHIYGEFQNVLLTDDEYHKLENINALSQIENLSSYIASTGKRYKSHYATILNWNRREKQQKEKDKYKGLSFREQELLRQEEITKQWLEEG